MGCALSAGRSGAERGPAPAEKSPKMVCAERKQEKLRTSKVGKEEAHAFREKIFRKKRQCGVCGQNIDSLGSFCRVCKMATHKKCEIKVTTACIPAPLSDLQRRSTDPSRYIQHPGSTRSLPYAKQRNTLPRSFSLDRVMERVMERSYDFDLTYITERIISVFFPPLLEEQRYRANLQEVASMLKSKHQGNFLLFNLSEKRHDIARISPKVQDFGWPDLHAPPLDKICAMCKAMEGWLTSDLQHVVVLLCKGNKGKTGVIVAAYMHYSKISAGADQALSTLAMRKFCEDKVSTSLQPSQNRYIYYFAGLLSGGIKMNSSPLFLHQVLIPSLPSFHTEGGYFPFLKIYQSMQLVYTSGVYDLQGSGGRRICITVEPALLLKGDIMVKCYNRQAHVAERETVFRLQFHTCTVHGAQLWFGKEELDVACSDDRFASDATVEFVFSSGPEKMKGWECQRNHPAVTVDYNTADPVVRWDSYENFNLRHQDSLEDIAHTRGPLDGSLYAQVKKRRGPGSGGTPTYNGRSADSPIEPLSPSHAPGHTPGRAPAELPEDVRCLPPPTWQEREELDRLLGGIEGRRARGGERERETAILDEGDAAPSLGRSCSCRHGAESPVFQPNGYCPNSADGRPAHPGPSSAPPTPLLEPFQRHHAHHHLAPPPPDVLWERQQQAPPTRLQRSCSEGPSRHLCPYPPQDLPLPPHIHTLPPPRLLYKGDDFAPLHPHYPHPRRSQPSSPYREMLLLDAPPPPGCPCRDCSCRREESAVAIKALHALRLDQGEGSHWGREAELRPCRDSDLHWDREAELHREAGLRRGREMALQWERDREAEMHWEREREAELWHRRSAAAPYGRHGNDLVHFAFDPLPSGHPAYPDPSHTHLYTHPHSHMDLKYSSGSSGYHTPAALYPCAPYQPSPSESRGYASGYQSESASPLPPHGHSSTTSLQDSAPPDDPRGSSGGPKSQGCPSNCQTGGSEDVTDSMAWQDSISQSSLRQDVRVTPSDLSGPPTPVDTSSPLLTQESSSSGDTEVCVRGVSAVPGSDTPVGPQDPDSPCPAPQGDQSDRKDPAHPDSLTPPTPQASPDRAAGEHGQPPAAAATPEPTESPKASVLSQTDPKSAPPLDPDPLPVSPGPGSTLNASTPPTERSLESLNAGSTPSPSPAPSSTPSTPQPPPASPERPPSSEPPAPGFATVGRRLGAEHLQPYPSVHGNGGNLKPPSPVPEGHSTPTFPLSSNYYLLNAPPVPYTGYIAVTIPTCPAQPPLPEKRRSSAPHGPAVGRGSALRGSSFLHLPAKPPGHSATHHVSFCAPVGEAAPQIGPVERPQGPVEEAEPRVSAKFVQDSSRFWYKPTISRDQAIAVLKDREPGAFLIRDSNSFHGAYGLALKVATPPASSSRAAGDPQEQLVRHFLIERGPRGVKIKGCQNEPYFGSLSALVYQHSITHISLPCVLLIPDKDPVGELQESQTAGNSTSTAADLLRQGAACNVLYLNSVETESLTGPQAVSKATNTTLSRSPRPPATVVHFKVSAQGVTLTDNQRRVFFRRHYPVNTVTYCSVDPQDRRWTNSDSTTSKMFGFVAKKPGSVSENVCHLFAELDPEQPATAIVNFINKVMLGPSRK
ncbi:tensin-2-like isoform X2 [Anguilla anguilla]|uniref:tensin-2-like isoform X2 n=1 Tax=Anguilla anguilla TaxID=7936 RepID=UPI0015B01624|nr:tensin-2-like isoform X2 [Anguilla anguilla]